MFQCTFSAALTHKAVPSANDLAKVATADITKDVLNASVNVVEPIYRFLGANDQVAKGTEFLKTLKAKLTEQFPPQLSPCDGPCLRKVTVSEL